MISESPDDAIWLEITLSDDLRRSRTSSRITSKAVGVDPNRDHSELIRVKFLAEPKGLPDTRLTLLNGRSQMLQVEGVIRAFEARRDPDAGYGVFAITVDSLTGRFAYSERFA